MLIATSNTGPVEILIPLLLVAAVIWGIYALLSRRSCPVCGRRIKRGLTTCPKCDADFATAQTSD